MKNAILRISGAAANQCSEAEIASAGSAKYREQWHAAHHRGRYRNSLCGDNCRPARQPAASCLRCGLRRQCLSLYICRWRPECAAIAARAAWSGGVVCGISIMPPKCAAASNARISHPAVSHAPKIAKKCGARCANECRSMLYRHHHIINEKSAFLRAEMKY